MLITDHFRWQNIVFYKHLCYLSFITEIQNTVYPLLTSIAIGIVVCSLYLINEL